MKPSLKTLSFMFFIPLLLLIYPLHSQGEEEASTQTKDIQIIDNPHEFGEPYYEYRVDKHKKINVSKEDIKNRILDGKAVYFLKEQSVGKRTIESEWIDDALKKNGI